MMAAWMLRSLVIASVLGAGALLLEWTLMAYRRPARWVWIGALAAAVAFTLIAPATSRPIASTSGDSVSVGDVTPTPVGRLATFQERAYGRLDELASRGARFDVPLVLAWLIASLLCGGTLLVAHRRLHAERSGWPRIPFEGHLVLMSDDLGPAVVGLARPEIVVPSWVIHMDAESRRLIALHECEHVRAGDQRLLMLGVLAVVAMPWNPALWWQLRRLRLAVEIDCDRRALRTGASVRRYGDLLLALGTRPRRPLIPAAALGERGSMLVRRVRAFTAARPRARPVRAAAAVACAAVLAGVVAAAPAPRFAPGPAVAPAVSSPVVTLRQTVDTVHLTARTTSGAILPALSRDVAVAVPAGSLRRGSSLDSSRYVFRPGSTGSARAFAGVLTRGAGASWDGRAGAGARSVVRASTRPGCQRAPAHAPCCARDPSGHPPIPRRHTHITESTR